MSVPPRVAAVVAVASALAVVVPHRAARGQRADGARPARLSATLGLLGGQLPAALRESSACGGSSGAGVGALLGVGYRLVGPLRAEAQLGGFEQPSAFAGADCVTAPAGAPLPPRPAGTVERSAGFDPQLADRRAFTQGRLAADLPAGDGLLRLSAGGGTLLRIRAPFASAGVGAGGRLGPARLLLEVEQWWMRAPTLDRTVTWQALPAPPGAPAGSGLTTPVVTSERRGTRGVRATWLRLGATLPLPGT